MRTLLTAVVLMALAASGAARTRAPTRVRLPAIDVHLRAEKLDSYIRDRGWQALVSRRRGAPYDELPNVSCMSPPFV